MKAFRIIVLIALAAAALAVVPARPVAAADYWNGDWSWYDGTYVPYYQRYYSYSPGYSTGYYGPAYSYYPPPTYGAYYGPSYGSYAPYGGAYYGVPGAGVGVYSAPAAVRVGPLGLGWR